MAAPFSRFQAYYAGTQDPYGATPELLQDTYSPGGSMTPASLLLASVSRAYPLAFLVSATGGRYPIVAPIDQPLLPGQGNPRKYALVGDVSGHGNLPPLIEIVSEYFRLTTQQPVAPIGDFDNKWANAPVGESYLEPEIVGVNGAVTTRTRYMVPIPHRYAATILEAYDQGNLTWRWLWQNIGSAIAQDPAQLQVYGPFVDYIRVSSTRRLGANAGDATRSPASVMDVPAALPTTSVIDQALDICRRYLPGLRAPDTVANQLAHIANQGVQTQQLINAANTTHTPTLAEKAPHLLRVVEAVTESTDPATWPAYWTLHPTLKSGSWMGAMEAACMTVSQRLRCQCPILSPSLATDLAAGIWRWGLGSTFSYMFQSIFMHISSSSIHRDH